MAGEEEAVKKAQTIEARARNISHNVRCTECGSQSIEDSQADVAVLRRKMIRDQIRAGQTDKEIYQKLEEDFGETVLYAPCFDLQAAGLWLSPIQQIRDLKDQLDMVVVREEYLSGHAFHMYNLTSPDQTVSFELQHNVCGRSIYAEGNVDAAIFLRAKVKANAEQRIYSMIDVLKEGNMR